MFKTRVTPVQLIAWALTLWATAACQQRCQPPEEAPLRSLVDAQWRLVESTDPDVAQDLDRFNFLIVTFNRNNSGDVKRVVDNDQFDFPVMTLEWVPQPENRLLRIRYTSAGGAGSNSSSGGAGNQGTFDYQYSLGRQLEMWEMTRGFYYRYVPFRGVINPDSTCVF